MVRKEGLGLGCSSWLCVLSMHKVLSSFPKMCACMHIHTQKRKKKKARSGEV